jgi:hypothetical protein
MDRRVAGFALSVVLIAAMLAAIAAMDSSINKGTPTFKSAPSYEGRWANYARLSVTPSDRLANPEFGVSSDGKYYVYDMIGDGAKFCAPDADFACISSGAIRFAVPRRELKMGDWWRFMGASFEVVPLNQDILPQPPPMPNEPARAGVQPIGMFGEAVMLYSILAHNNDSQNPCIDLYLYSRKRGLIGDLHQCKSAIASFSFLKDTYGPGSQEFDSRIPPSALLSSKELADLTR